MRSIQRTLTTQLLLSVGLLACVTAGGLYVHLRSVLRHDFDGEVMEEVREIGGLVRREDCALEFDFSERAMPEYGRDAPDPRLFQIWDARGGVFARSPSLGKSGDLTPIRDAAAALPSETPFDVVLPDGRAGRAVKLIVPPVEEAEGGGDHRDRQREGPGAADRPSAIASAADGAAMTIVFAGGRRSIDELLRDLAVSFIVLVAALIGGAVVVVLSFVRAGLRPLVSVGEQAAQIDAASLDYRFQHDPLPAELRPITLRLNDLLARLGQAFHRERSFTANVAHELRTPITELRALAEVALKWPEISTARPPEGDGNPSADGSGSNAAMKEVLEIACQMERTVHALLTLLRAQVARQPVKTEAIALDVLIEEMWCPLRAAAEARRLTCDFHISAGQTVWSDRTLLSSILYNLFANTVRYCTEGGRIICTLESGANGEHKLVVGNSNASLVPADLPRLTEPFWRKDAARTSAAQSGLGLAIVEALCQALDIHLGLELERGDWFEATLAFSANTSPSNLPPHAEPVTQTMVI